MPASPLFRPVFTASRLGAILLATGSGWALAQTPSYQTRILSPLPLASRSSSYDLSPSGVVVGSTLVSVLSVPRQSERAVYWPAGSSSPRRLTCLSAQLPSASATPCLALGLNGRGLLAGWSAAGTSTTKRAVLWSSVTATPIDLSGALTAAGLRGTASWARAVNDQGQVLGVAESADTVELRPFIWQAGQVRVMPLPDAALSQIRPVGLDEQGVAVVTAYRTIDNNLLTGIVGHEVTLRWHPDDRVEEIARFTAMDVSPAGHLAGRACPVGRPVQAALWWQGGLELLATEAGLSSEAFAVNRHGVAVGWHTNPGNTAPSTRAVIWTPGQMRRDLSALATPPWGYHYNRGAQINDVGQIVVDGTTSTRVQSIVLTPRP